MAFRKEPIITDRAQVVAIEARRRRLRSKFLGDAAAARITLNPKYRFRLWMDRNKAQAHNVINDASRAARKGAPVAAVIGIGALLFAARRPISKWISGLKRPITSTDD